MTLPVETSTRQTPSVRPPPGATRSARETTGAAAGELHSMPRSTMVPGETTATFSRRTHGSRFSPCARRSSFLSFSWSGVSVCSTTTTLKPFRARRSAFSAKFFSGKPQCGCSPPM